MSRQARISIRLVHKLSPFRTTLLARSHGCRSRHLHRLQCRRTPKLRDPPVLHHESLLKVLDYHRLTWLHIGTGLRRTGERNTQRLEFLLIKGILLYYHQRNPLQTAVAILALHLLRVRVILVLAHHLGLTTHEVSRPTEGFWDIDNDAVYQIH